MAYIGSKPADKALTGADIEDGTIQIADLAATGTKDATTFLRGDGTFASAGGLSASSNSIIKAWVKWTGTTIGDSYNVSSVTNPTTGGYTINFTDSMDNANFATVASLYGQTFANTGFELESQATGSTSVRAKNFSNNGVNNMGGGGFGCVIVIGDNASI